MPSSAPAVGPSAHQQWVAAMRQGDFATAWRISDAVLAARDPATRDDPRKPYHQRWVWDGRPLDGQDVTVRCYHGLGDTIQFARFLPALAARAASVTLEVQPELLRLMAAQPGPPRLVAFDPAHPLPGSQAEVEIMELSHALRIAPDAAPYLRADAMGPRGLGVCWQAGTWDAARSIDPGLLLPLLPGAVSLQREAIGEGADVLDTARRIAGFDLVVSVDTMAAHLAGALGRPTCLLLKAEADWRWGTGRGVRWYGSVRAVRQAQDGDWQPALAEMSGMVEAVHHRVRVA